MTFQSNIFWTIVKRQLLAFIRVKIHFNVIVLVTITNLYLIPFVFKGFNSVFLGMLNKQFYEHIRIFCVRMVINCLKWN